MSSARAIAAVTAVLKDLLLDGLINHDVMTEKGPIKVTALAPGLINADEQKLDQLNLFMYRVAPNSGWSNAAFPSRDSQGNRMSNPPLALDLYYMLTAYGSKDLHAELLLGYAMQLMHEMPLLTRAAIRNALEPEIDIDGDGLIGKLKKISTSDLAEQTELVKITPVAMTVEEISKLWTAFQAKYRPSATYHVSVVLIESNIPSRSPLPVLTRGPVDPVTKVERGIVAQPNLLPPYPTLQEAVPDNNQIAVRMGEELTLKGNHLDEVSLIRFKHLRLQKILELPVKTVTSTELKVRIPADPASGSPATSSEDPDNWQAGLYSVAAVIQLSGEPEKVTNEVSVALAPKITEIKKTSSAPTLLITLKCSPKILKGQQISLWVRDREIIPDQLVYDSNDQTTDIKFKLTISEWPSGESQLVRLRVDGVDSIFIDRAEKTPVFFANQQVTIP